MREARPSIEAARIARPLQRADCRGGARRATRGGGGQAGSGVQRSMGMQSRMRRWAAASGQHAAAAAAAAARQRRRRRRRQQRRRQTHLGSPHVVVVDGAEGVVLHVPAERRQAGPNVQPGHHHPRDQLAVGAGQVPAGAGSRGRGTGGPLVERGTAHNMSAITRCGHASGHARLRSCMPPPPPEPSLLPSCSPSPPQRSLPGGAQPAERSWLQRTTPPGLA